MCVIHCGLRLGMSEPVQPHRHGRIDLIKQRGVAMPESMKAALLYAQLPQEWMKLPLAYQAVIPWRSLRGREQQTKSVWPPCFQIRPQVIRQLRRDWKSAIALSRFDRLKLPTPHTLPNVNDSVLRVHVLDPQSANLTTSDSGFGQNHIERAIGLSCRVN